MLTTPVVVAVVLYWSKNRNTEAELHPVMIIAEADSRDATTAISKEANIVTIAYGRRKNVRRKRTKQLIAILLSITIITLSTAKPYQEAKATGLEGAAGAAVGLGSLTPHGRLLILASVLGLGLAITIVPSQFDEGRNEELKKFYDKAGKKMKDDFVNYSTQALNNNVSAAEQERENSAHAKAVIEDFLESASAGVIDTTSEAWDWFRNFVSDIKAALAPPKSMNGYVGKDLSGVYENVATVKNKSTGEVTKYSIEFKGADISLFGFATGFVGVNTDWDDAFAVRLAGIRPDNKAWVLGMNDLQGHDVYYRWIVNGNTWDWVRFDDKAMMDGFSTWNYDMTISGSIPRVPYDNVTLGAAPAAAGTTDVPGVSNVNDYISIGSDLPYTRPEGAWDICDPNGKKGQISIGNDIPGKLGYDDWYDVLGGIANGEATWEQVANASDVIRIGSDTDSPYSSDNADAWGAYVDGTIIGYDVTAEGDVVITLEGGKVITIPQEYADGIEFTNEQDKAQELDKDTTFPVSGTLAYPLPGALEGNPTADPDPGGGGGGSITVDPDVSDYTLDFRKLFPFCIPFDIYKAVKLLDATPTAPVVHYKFYLSKSKTYIIDLNLNKFNTVAAILRRMECLLFIIGLATATRRIYIRG